MPSLDDLKKRIKSVKSTQKITKAMKMVAAAKLKKAQDDAEKGRPYSDKIHNIILNLTKSVADPENSSKLLVGTGNDKTYLCLVMTADRGLCGGFNTNICKLAKKFFKQSLSEKKILKIVTVGTKGFDQLKKEYGKFIIEKRNFKNVKKVSFSQANEIGKFVLENFKKNEFDKCFIFFNNFKNVITQVPQMQQIIPIAKSVTELETQKESKTSNLYEYEPEEEEILEDLLPKNISTQIFKALLENAASEQGSRMTAMDNATRNAGDLVEKLTITYNRSRQASITKELIEIISGAESL